MTRRLRPPARSSLGQKTAIPALSSALAPSRMRSARRSSSSGRVRDLLAEQGTDRLPCSRRGAAPAAGHARSLGRSGRAALPAWRRTRRRPPRGSGRRCSRPAARLLPLPVRVTKLDSQCEARSPAFEAGGRLGEPWSQLRRLIGLGRSEQKRAAGARCCPSPREGIGKGVPGSCYEQGWRMNLERRSCSRQDDRVPERRHGVRKLGHKGVITGLERPGTPGVAPARAEPRIQAAAGDQADACGHHRSPDAQWQW